MKRPSVATDAICVLLLNIGAAVIAIQLKDLLIGEFVYVILTLIFVFAYCISSKIDLKSTFHFCSPTLKKVIQVIILSISCTGVLLLLMMGQFKLFDAIGLDFTEDSQKLEKVISSLGRGGFLPLFFLVAVLAPIVEELLFRGVILSSFRNSFVTWRAVIYSSLLFAAMHGMVPRMAGTFFLGIVYALVVIYTGSIFLVMICHIVNNAAYLLVSQFVDATSLYKSDIDQSVLIIFSLFLLLSPIIFILTLKAVYRGYSRLKQNAS